ncbi:MAG TPA: amino acid permease [Bacteroidales bacterium]|jgi:APA family basic amino acid/polyamine antiporter|nr:amino acid permease [Bacteroidales bacterium]MBP7037179.1 amino acid permease [Bacteroidales bacterium]MBP8710218.1 amino acid permease [Bacteroidales bacterium]HQI12888.1 amino acid permease [Bacteroidales bacterium]HQJ14733.1 amino acid permease [Bacteroidales bacterium]
MANKLFRTKSLQQMMATASDSEHGLKRALSATNLIFIGIGCIIGTGIFVITGTAAAQYAGPALSISFLISAIVCMFVALCYTEFASMIPIAGSAYSYAYTTVGEFLAWFIGWNLVLEYIFGASLVAVGWSGYVVSFLKDWGIVIPPGLCNAPLDYHDGWITTGAMINLPSIFIVALITTVLVFGIKESVRFNNIIVVIKIAVILLFIGFGLSYINPDNYVPFIPENTGVHGEFGWSGIFRAAGIIFLAFVGFDAVSTVAQEAKNPQRDMAKGILGSLIIVTILYIAVSLVLTGMVNYKYLNVPDPIAVGIDSAGPGLFWLRPIIKIGAIAGMSSVILVLITGMPRILYSMSNDGLLPPVLGRVHKKYRTPHITTIIVGSIIAVISGLFPIDLIGELVSIGTLLAFAMVCISIMILRVRRPDMNRPFRTPVVYFVGTAGAAGCFYLMFSLPGSTWFRLGVWTVIGFLIYFLYGRKHSKLNV